MAEVAEAMRKIVDEIALVIILLAAIAFILSGFSLLDQTTNSESGFIKFLQDVFGKILGVIMIIFGTANGISGIWLYTKAK